MTLQDTHHSDRDREEQRRPHTTTVSDIPTYLTQCQNRGQLHLTETKTDLS